MKPAPFDYFAARTIDDALALLGRYGGDARPIAGGQSLVPMLAFRLARPSVLIDLNRIEGFAEIINTGEELRIGAMARQGHLLASPLVEKHAPLLAEALLHVGHPPTRARGTIGGSIAHADPAAELPVVMIALAAKLVIRGPAGDRVVEAEEFFLGMFETAIGEDELLVEIRIPIRNASNTAFAEISRRKGDFAVVSAAVCVEIGPGLRFKLVRAVLGAVGPVPVRLRECEDHLIGKELDERMITNACEGLGPEIFELDHADASRHYRMKVAPVLLRRALVAACAKGRAFV